MDVTVVPLHVRSSKFLPVLKRPSVLKLNRGEQKLQVGHSAGRDENIV